MEISINNSDNSNYNISSPVKNSKHNNSNELNIVTIDEKEFLAPESLLGLFLYCKKKL